MGSPWYEIMLGMSYYIHAGGLGALKALPGSVSKRVTPVAVIVLAWSVGEHIGAVCEGHGRDGLVSRLGSKSARKILHLGHL